MAFINNALGNNSSAFTVSSLASTADSGVIIVNSVGQLAKVETGVPGEIFVGSATIPSFLAAGGIRKILRTQGAGADAQWSTSTYPISIDQGDVLIGTASNAIGRISTIGAVNKYVLTAGGANIIPTWKTTGGSAGGGLKWVQLGASAANPTTAIPGYGYIVYHSSMRINLPAVGGIFGQMVSVILTKVNSELTIGLVSPGTDIIIIGQKQKTEFKLRLSATFMSNTNGPGGSVSSDWLTTSCIGPVY